MKASILLFTVALFMLAAFIYYAASCYRKFYKVADTPGNSDLASVVSNQPEKYFILRLGTSAFHMQNIVLDSDNKRLPALDRISPDHLTYLIESKKQGIHYLPSKEGEVLNEVHIYALQDNQLQYGSSYVLDFNKISKLKYWRKTKAHNNKHHHQHCWYCRDSWSILAAIVGSSSSTSGGGGSTQGQGSARSLAFIMEMNL